MLSIGLLGATGYMGAPFCTGLLKAHRARQLNLVILHRPQPDLSKYPNDVEKREVDLENGSVSKIAEAVKDLQVVMSAVSFRAFETQYKLIDALADSPELVTFFPSEYATPYSKDSLENRFLSLSNQKLKVLEHAKARRVPVTKLANATTPELLMGFPPFSSYDPRANKLELYYPTGNGKRGLTSKEFSSGAIVHLLTKRLQDLPGKDFSLVEISFSSDDLISAFTKVHNGQPPQISRYSEQDYQRDMNKDFLSAMGAARTKGLVEGTEWPGEVISDFDGWEKKDLEYYVRECMEVSPPQALLARAAEMTKPRN